MNGTETIPQEDGSVLERIIRDGAIVRENITRADGTILSRSYHANGSLESEATLSRDKGPITLASKWRVGGRIYDRPGPVGRPPSNLERQRRAAGFVRNEERHGRAACVVLGQGLTVAIERGADTRRGALDRSSTDVLRGRHDSDRSILAQR